MMPWFQFCAKLVFISVVLHILVTTATLTLTELTDETFDAAIKTDKYYLIIFYAPWCSVCQGILPTWDEAAKQLDSTSVIKIGKVDAVANVKLTQHYNIIGYPKIKYFWDGNLFDYEAHEGLRNANKIIEFVHNASVKASRKPKKLNCENGAACIFMGKTLGWIPYEDKPSWQRTVPVDQELWKHPQTKLFISISSYRDKLCPYTLYNLFSKALHPTRLVVAVIQQNAVEDEDCFLAYCRLMKENPPERIYSTTYNSDYKPFGWSTVFNTDVNCPYWQNIKMNRVAAEDARGPTWARAKGSAMVDNEDFCMQTDSHMDFVSNWDAKMLEMWAATNNEYAILSTYVTDVAELPRLTEGSKGINNMNEVPHLCMVTHGQYNLVRNWGTKSLRGLPKPKPTNAIWGAGLSFSRCHAEKKAPYDPFTPGVFDGEEFSRAARFWTYGYDIYSPHRVYVVHNYHKSQSDPLHFGWARHQVNEQQEMQASVNRLKTLLELPQAITTPEQQLALQRSKYGLGDRRSITQLIDFCGINLHKFEVMGNNCGNLDYVPFTEHPWGADYIPLFNMNNEYIDVVDPGSIYFQNTTEEWMKWHDADRQHQLKQAVQPLIGDTRSANVHTSTKSDAKVIGAAADHV